MIKQHTIKLYIALSRSDVVECDGDDDCDHQRAMFWSNLRLFNINFIAYWKKRDKFPMYSKS